MKTYVPKKESIEKKWWLIDAENQILGRLATEVAVLIRGKRKPQYADFIDCGDHVVVINAGKIKFSGKKIQKKKYYSHSGYPGGIKEKNLEEMMEKNPEEVVLKAVRGMIPKNKLNRAVHKKLKVYRGPDHPHDAQNPQKYKL
ncbi:MAG: 50S ribosomal protein L13 [Candidatus Aminicenantaceae bacterium]